MTVFLGGDVMLGRGVDQILPHPSEPRLYEDDITSALDYVTLAEKAHGEIEKPVNYAYVWGDALAALEDAHTDARIVNLETSVTCSTDPEPKGINYKMHPRNLPVLRAAGIDCCVLANNHVLDWGRTGLTETLDTLASSKLKTVGAGRNLAEASAPAIIDVSGRRRVVVFAFGSVTSGIPRSWAATPDRAGVNLLPDFSTQTLGAITDQLRVVRRPEDLVIVSLHWGSNWGYEVPHEEREFARALIDEVGADIVHGHSSHHPKAIEVYRQKLILYGCGDLLNDYEGIHGYEDFRGNLVLMYFATIDLASGTLEALQMKPLQIKNFRLAHATHRDSQWLRRVLTRECGRYGCAVDLSDDGQLQLSWT